MSFFRRLAVSDVPRRGILSKPFQVLLGISLLAGLALSQTPAPAQEKVAFVNVSSNPGLNPTGSIATVNTDGTNEKIVVLGTGMANPDISSDGSKIVYEKSNQIWMIDLSTNSQRQLTASTDFNTARDPAWSPNGTQIAFEGVKPRQTTSHIYTLTVSNGQWRQITGTRTNPDTSVNPSRGPDVVGLRENTQGSSNENDPVWAPDGSQIAFSTDRHYMTNPGTGTLRTNTEIYLINVSSLAETRVTILQGSNFERNPDWSPTGKIAFETGSSVLRIGEVSRTMADVTGVTYLTNTTAPAREPSYSPDGSRIAFIREGSGSHVFTMRAVPESSTNTATRITRINARQPSWGKANTAPTPTPGTRTIRGRVKINTEGISGVNVFLVANNNFAALYSSGPDIRRAVTQSSPANEIGNYVFTDVPPGSYHVVPFRPGFYFSPVNKPVSVSTADVNNVDFQQAGSDSIAPTVTISAPATGTAPSVTEARGTISDTGGSGVQAVVVALARLGANQVYNWIDNTYVAGSIVDYRVFKVANLSTDRRNWSLALPAASLSTPGTYRLTVTGIDNAFKTQTTTREFTIGSTTPSDSTAPNGTITAPLNGNTSSFTAVRGTATDNVALDHVKIGIIRRVVGTSSTQYQYWNGTTWTTATTIPNGTTPSLLQLAGALSPYLAYGDTRLPRVTLTGTSANWSYPSVPTGNDTYYVAAAIYDRARNVKLLPGPSTYFLTVTVQAQANDTVAPNGTITAPTNGATSLAAVRGTATDNVALDHAKIGIIRRVVGTSSTQYQHWNGTGWTTVTTIPNGTTPSLSQLAAVLLPYLAFADTRLPRVSLTGTSTSWSYNSVPTTSDTYYVAAAIYDRAGNVKVLPGAPGYFLTVVVQSGTTTRPQNDNFASARDISGNTGSSSSSNAGATLETGEPVHATTAGGHSIWFRWTAPSAGSAVFFTVGSNIRNVIAVYTGSAVGSLTRVAFNIESTGDTFNDNNYQVRFTTEPGRVYYIAVDGRGTAVGNITLNWQFTASTPSTGPGNNNIANAQAISGGTGSVNGTNVGANREPNESNHVPPSGGHTVWYRWTAVSTGRVRFSSTGATPVVITPYTGSSPTSLSGISHTRESGGNPYTISFNVTAGQVCYIVVDGQGTATGTFTLNWSPATTSALTARSAALSNATANAATDSVQLGFTSALEAASASDVSSFVVSVNGRAMVAESASYNAATRTVSLSLAAGVLQPGDTVAVSWNHLKGATGGGYLSGNTTATAR